MQERRSTTMRTLTLDDDMPATARRLWNAAEQHGWTVWTTTATGTPVEHDGSPQYVKTRIPLTGEDGKPLTTPTGKPRIEIVTTNTPVVIESVVVRLVRKDVRLAAIWEDGRFYAALQQRPFRKLTSPEVTALVTAVQP